MYVCMYVGFNESIFKNQRTYSAHTVLIHIYIYTYIHTYEA